MTREMDVTSDDFLKIKKVIVMKTDLDGRMFEQCSCEEFIVLFSNIDGIEESVWRMVYEQLMFCQFQEFETTTHIDWELVGSVLWDHDFMGRERTIQEQHKLLNDCLDRLEAQKLGFAAFQKAICDAYGKTDGPEN